MVLEKVPFPSCCNIWCSHYLNLLLLKQKTFVVVLVLEKVPFPSCYHKYGSHYQSGNIPLRNSNECDGNKNKHLCHGIYTPGVTDNCDSEQQTRSKSIRWTKDQLRKIDKVDIDRNNSFTKNQTGWVDHCLSIDSLYLIYQ